MQVVKNISSQVAPIFLINLIIFLKKALLLKAAQVHFSLFKNKERYFLLFEEKKIFSEKPL